jgi:hypothetical protein
MKKKIYIYNKETCYSTINYAFQKKEKKSVRFFFGVVFVCLMLSPFFEVIKTYVICGFIIIM